jgi:hypothetical protein
MGFSCVHHYPHSSFATRNTLKFLLKGFDMAIYHSFERLNGEVNVLAVINDKKWKEHLAEREETDDGKFYLSTDLFPVAIGMQSEDEQPLSPEGFGYYDKESTSRNKWVECFPGTDVTWLNGSPKSFGEFAGVYPVDVSPYLHLSRDEILNFLVLE